MRASTIVSSLVALATAAASSDTILDFYPEFQCGGPQAVVADPTQSNGVCQPLSYFESAEITLNFTGAYQTLTLYDDTACTSFSVKLGNFGADDTVKAEGQCISHDSYSSVGGWQSFIYSTYR